MCTILCALHSNLTEHALLARILTQFVKEGTKWTGRLAGRCHT